MIFIVGYSRSGTKMMNKILSQAQIADIVPEMHFFEQFYHFDSKSHKEALDNFKDLCILKKFLMNRLTLFGERSKLENGILISDIDKQLNKLIKGTNESVTQVDVYRKFAELVNTRLPTDPTPRNAYYIKQIANIIPNSKFIYMVRDPRDCILSQSIKWRQYYYDKNMPMEAFRLLINYNPSLMARFWKNSFKGLQSAQAQGVKKDILVIYYEQAIKYPQKVINKLGDFLEVKVSKDIDLNFIRSDNSNKWKEGFTKKELYLIESIISQELEYLNYEKSKFSLLDKIKGNILNIYYFLKMPLAILLNLKNVKRPLSVFKTRIWEFKNIYFNLICYIYNNVICL